MEKGTILITGVAGFIGSHLAEKLLITGYAVIGIDNLANGFRSNLNSIIDNTNFTFIADNYESVAFDSLPSLDGIYHLASGKIPRDKNDSGLQTISETMHGLSWIAEVWKIYKCRLIFTSTSEVYGPLATIPFKETEPISIGLPANKRWVYAASKIHAEQFLFAFAREHALSLSIARLFSVFGPRQHPTWRGGVQSAFIQQVKQGLPIEIHGSGKQKRVFTYIDDAIDALFLMLTTPEAENRIINIQGSAKDEIAILDLAKLIISLFRINPTSYQFTYNSEPNSEGEDEIMIKIADTTLANALLNWQPKINLRQGLQLIIN